MTHEMLEFIRHLNAKGARSMVIGGYALAFLGVPRYTKDLDLWIDMQEAPRVLEAIKSFFGGDDLGLTLEDLSTPGVVQLGYEPNQVDLVLLNEPDFDEAYARSQTHEVGGVTVQVVSRDDFVRLKKAFGRSIDLRDIDMKPIARKYRFDEVPSEKERWQALPLEVRLQAVVEMALFWARLHGQQGIEKIHPVARKRPLAQPKTTEDRMEDSSHP